MTEPVQTPPGVDLVDWDDYPKKRQMIFDNVKSAFQDSFPHTYGGVRWEVSDLNYENPKEFSFKDQKEALLKDQYLHHKLKGNMRLFDDKTGDLLDERPNVTVARVPYLTERGTFIHGGNEYSTISQARLMPGIYSRRKANGELEAQVNARRGTGMPFRVRLEPESGLFKLDVGQSQLRLYSLLKDIGVSDEEMGKSWGPELLQRNQDGYDARVFDKAYQRLVRYPNPHATREEKVKAIKDAMAATKVSRTVTRRTLPNALAAQST